MDTPDFEYVSDMVRRKAAIVLEREKNYLIESRLLPLARDEAFTSIGELVAKLRTTTFGSLHEKVVEAMTTNETSFFRDVQPFEALRKVIIPEILEKRSAKRQLRIWCAACSTGQEPYTIAMILKEHFPELEQWDVQILATDIATKILDKAKAGCFSQIEINRGLPVQYVLKYFDRSMSNWTIKPGVKKLVEFRELNLIEAWPRMPTMDIVFIRNVMIYFDVPTKKDILRKIKLAIARDGYMFMGGAETTINIDQQFSRLQVDKASVYCLK